jgi:hypothetical protein
LVDRVADAWRAVAALGDEPPDRAVGWNFPPGEEAVRPVSISYV